MTLQELTQTMTKLGVTPLSRKRQTTAPEQKAAGKGIKYSKGRRKLSIKSSKCVKINSSIKKVIKILLSNIQTEKTFPASQPYKKF